MVIKPRKDNKINLEEKYRKSRGKTVYLLFCKMQLFDFESVMCGDNACM